MNHTKTTTTILLSALVGAILAAGILVVGLHYRDTVSMAHAAPTPTTTTTTWDGLPDIACDNFDGSGVSCVDGYTGTVYGPACVIVPFTPEMGERAGYGGGVWAEENGDGAIIGYAMAEDSIIYTTEVCAKTGALYPN